MSLIIKNARLVNPEGIVETDILVDDGTIVDIGDIEYGADSVLDAQSQYVTPGGIDAHVHLQYHVCGCDTADDFENGMIAAAIGGTTTIIDFVEAFPDESLFVALERRKAQADSVAPIDYSLHMSILPTDMGKLDQIPYLVKDGCPTFKHYMAYSFALNDGQLYRSMETIGRSHGMALVHAENWDIIQELIRDLRNEGKIAPIYHMFSRPNSLEAQAIGRAIDASILANCPTYICHVTCEEGIEKIKSARQKYPIWGETCTHYCRLNDSAFLDLDMKAICSPPLRTESDRQATVRAVVEGDLQVMSSDHCPFTTAEKMRAKAFNEAPGGLTGIEGRFMLTRDLFDMTWERWVECCCTAPANIMGLQRKGRIAMGYDADLVIWNQEKHTITATSLHENADWTPYERFQVSVKPQYVFSRGKLIVKDGEFIGELGHGQYTKRYLDIQTSYQEPIF